MKTGRRSFRSERGFTLLELLVTLAVLSLLSLALFGSLGYGTRVWEASHDGATATDEVREAQERLAALIASAYPEFSFTANEKAAIAFTGLPDTLNLLAPDPLIRGAFDDVTITTRQESGHGTLIVERKLELASDPAAPPIVEKLVEGVSALHFQYFGQANPNDAPEWQERWDGHSRPPLLVRIRAEMKKRGAVWPSMTVSPRVMADVSCTLDIVSNFCEGR